MKLSLNCKLNGLSCTKLIQLTRHWHIRAIVTIAKYLQSFCRPILLSLSIKYKIISMVVWISEFIKEKDRALARILKLLVIFERAPAIPKKKNAVGKTQAKHASHHSVGSRGRLRASGGVQGQRLGGVPGGKTPKFWGFSYFNCFRRALLDLN